MAANCVCKRTNNPPEMGVALWLCPRKNTPLHDKLTTLMSSLNTLFPGQPPRFDPHITITTNVAVDLQDPAKTRDDVDKILLASAVALSSLPKNHTDLVTLAKVDSQRKFFKKLYFQVVREPNLISFARIIRELFVIVPQDIELENRKQNPHIYHTDSKGNVTRKKPKKYDEATVKQFDTAAIVRDAAAKAAQWSTADFDPHLSLVYSDIYPIDSALWRTIKTRIQDYLNVDGDDPGLSWDGGVLQLVLCEGDVNDWIVLGNVDVH